MMPPASSSSSPSDPLPAPAPAPASKPIRAGSDRAHGLASRPPRSRPAAVPATDATTTASVPCRRSQRRKRKMPPDADVEAADEVRPSTKRFTPAAGDPKTGPTPSGSSSGLVRSAPDFAAGRSRSSAGKLTKRRRKARDADDENVLSERGPTSLTLDILPRREGPSPSDSVLAFTFPSSPLASSSRFYTFLPSTASSSSSYGNDRSPPPSSGWRPTAHPQALGMYGRPGSGSGSGFPAGPPPKRPALVHSNSLPSGVGAGTQLRSQPPAPSALRPPVLPLSPSPILLSPLPSISFSGRHLAAPPPYRLPSLPEALLPLRIERRKMAAVEALGKVERTKRRKLCHAYIRCVGLLRSPSRQMAEAETKAPRAVSIGLGLNVRPPSSVSIAPPSSPTPSRPRVYAPPAPQTEPKWLSSPCAAEGRTSSLSPPEACCVGTGQGWLSPVHGGPALPSVRPIPSLVVGDGTIKPPTVAVVPALGGPAPLPMTIGAAGPPVLGHQAPMKAQLLAILKLRSNQGPGEAGTRFKKWVMWNAWMRKEAQRGALFPTVSSPQMQTSPNGVIREISSAIDSAAFENRARFDALADEDEESGWSDEDDEDDDFDDFEVAFDEGQKPLPPPETLDSGTAIEAIEASGEKAVEAALPLAEELVHARGADVADSTTPPPTPPPTPGPSKTDLASRADASPVPSRPVTTLVALRAPRPKLLRSTSVPARLDTLGSEGFDLEPAKKVKSAERGPPTPPPSPPSEQAVAPPMATVPMAREVGCAA